MARKGRARQDSSCDLVDRLLSDWRRERPDLDAGPMAVVGRILRIGRELEARANAALRPLDIRYTDLDVLATLRRVGKPYALTPTTLCRSVLITSGAMTACIDRLERASLLERRTDGADRRHRVVALTPEGRRLIDRAIALRFAEAREAVGALSAADARALAGLLKKLSESLEVA